jgi:hypothetical protein
MLDIRSLKGKLSFTNTFFGTDATSKAILFALLIVKSAMGLRFIKPRATAGRIVETSLLAIKPFYQ